MSPPRAMIMVRWPAHLTSPFFWAFSQKVNQRFVHIFLLVNDNNPSFSSRISLFFCSTDLIEMVLLSTYNIVFS